MRLSLIVYVVWTISCLGGNLFHLHWISSKYFEYEVTTNVQLYFPETIDNPSVLMCIDSIKLYRWGNMTYEEKIMFLIRKSTGEVIPYWLQPKYLAQENKRYKTNYTIRTMPIDFLTTEVGRSTEMAIREFVWNLEERQISIRDQFRLTWRQEDIITTFTLDSSNKKYIANATSRGLIKMTQFFRGRGRHKCFLFEHEDKTVRTHNYEILRDPSLNKMLSSYHFTNDTHWIWTRMGDVQYYLSPPGYDNFDVTERITVKVNGKGEIGNKITYRVYRTHLLPPPYTTNCRNYSREGLKTQRGCYQTCLRRLSLERESKLHPSVWVMYPGDIDRSILGSNGKDNAIIKDIEGKCSLHCRRKECSTYIYVPQLMVTETLSHKKGNASIHIEQLISMAPVIQSDSLERVALIQYLTDVGSSFGFWLGLSAVGVEGMIGHVVLRMFDAFSKKQVHREDRNRRLGQHGQSFVSKNYDDLDKIRKTFYALRWMASNMQSEFDTVKGQVIQRKNI